jgi:uncharacterized membrane protein YsdA (DUF1294 family)
VSGSLALIEQLLTTNAGVFEMGVFETRGDLQRLGERWLLICDTVGGALGAAIAVAVLVALVS